MMTDTIYHLPENHMSRLEISSYIQSAVEAFCNWASRTGQAPNLNSSECISDFAKQIFEIYFAYL